MSTGTLRQLVGRLKSYLAGQGESASDRDLLRRFTQQRDETAFAALVQRHGALVFGVCRRILQHTHDAEDAFQATFLILARKAAQGRWDDSIRNWLHLVAQRVAHQARLRAARRHEATRADPAAVDNPDPSWREVGAILDEELTALPVQYREVLLLCCLEGKTRDEVAACLGCSVGRVKGLLERGRDLLGRRLTRRGVTYPAAVLAGCGLLHRPPPTLLLISTVRVGMNALQGQTTGIAPAVLLLAQTKIDTLALRLVTRITAGVLLLGLALGGIWGSYGTGNTAVNQTSDHEGETNMKQGVMVAGILLGLAVPLAQADGERDQPRERAVQTRGLITAFDAAKGSITLFRRDDDNPDGKSDTYTFTKEVRVELEERQVELRQVQIYTEVTLTLNADKKSVAAIRIPLPPQVQGGIKSIDADKNTITVLLRGERERDGVERTLVLGKDTRIFAARQEMKLSDLKVNDRVLLRLMPDRKTLFSVQAFRADGERDIPRERDPRRPEVPEVIKALDPTKGTITFTRKSDRGAVDVTLKLGAEVKVFIGEKEAKRADLQVGETASYKVGTDRETIVEIRLQVKRERERDRE